MEDISKFDALLQHANYHQEMYGDPFFEFLSEHYGEQMASHQNQHDEHEDLPFKDSQHMFSHINTSFTLFKSVIYSTYTSFSIKEPLNFSYTEPFSLFEKPSVFQPPKSA